MQTLQIGNRTVTARQYYALAYLTAELALSGTPDGGNAAKTESIAMDALLHMDTMTAAYQKAEALLLRDLEHASKAAK